MFSLWKIKVVEKFSNNINLKIDDIKKCNLDNGNKSEIVAPKQELEVPSTNHFIGLIFTNSISMNAIHNLGWDKDLFYLNYTNIYLKNNKTYPIIMIDNADITKKFKYKKYIKNYIKKKYNIGKNNIISIKFYETNNNLHNYIIILKDINSLGDGRSSLSTRPDIYSWRNILSWFKIDDIGKEPLQNEIYSLILKNDYQVDYNFSPECKENYPKYIKEYKVKLCKLNKIFENIAF